MPIYSFICSCGAKKEVVRPMSESDLPVLCDVDGFVMQRDLQTDFGKQHHGDCWPMVSVAAGINSSQVDEFRKMDAQMGIPTEYTKDGDVVFKSREHRKRYCEAHHLYDRNGGCGDPEPKYR